MNIVFGQQSELMPDAEPACIRDDQMGFDAVDACERFEKPYTVYDAGGAGDCNNQPARQRGRLHSTAKRCCNSPDSYISVMMSEPPINSPFTYSCGMVGQLENCLMPSRMSLSSST